LGLRDGLGGHLGSRWSEGCAFERIRVVSSILEHQGKRDRGLRPALLERGWRRVRTFM
jgi:hypothetical protein